MNGRIEKESQPIDRKRDAIAGIAKKLKPTIKHWNAKFDSTGKWDVRLKKKFVELTQFDAVDPYEAKKTWKMTYGEH